MNEREIIEKMLQLPDEEKKEIMKEISYPQKLYRFRSLGKPYDNDTIKEFEEGKLQYGSLENGGLNDSREGIHKSTFVIPLEIKRYIIECFTCLRKYELEKILKKIPDNHRCIILDLYNKYVTGSNNEKKSILCMINKLEYSDYKNDSNVRLSWEEGVIQFRANYAVACFSSNVDNHNIKKMWDEYANGGNGFYVEYDMKDIILNAKKYPMPVIYDNETNITDLGNYPEIQFLLKNESEWQHEKEYRILIEIKDSERRVMKDFIYAKKIVISSKVDKCCRSVLEKIAKDKNMMIEEYLYV